MPLPHDNFQGRGAGGAGGVSGLYEFTSSFRLDPVKTGAVGASSLTELRNMASGDTNGFLTDTNYFTRIDDGKIEWTVPHTGTYRLTTAGADGTGATLKSTGSYNRGAIIVGDVSLTEGDVLQIVVGQLGTVSAGSEDGMGGGASVIYNSTTSTLLQIGGGGGGIQYRTNTNQTTSNASLTKTPNSIEGSSTEDTMSHVIASGGNGGDASRNNAAGEYLYTGGGGGWLTSGENGNVDYSNISMHNSGGKALSGNAKGGTTGNFNHGGFGGGSAAHGGYTGGGAGGGYNGGNAGAWGPGWWGQGGSSFYDNVTLYSSSLKPAPNGSEAHGYVIIQPL